MIRVLLDSDGQRWEEARRVHDQIWPHNNRGWWERGLALPNEYLFLAQICGSVVGYLLGEHVERWSVGHEVAVIPQLQGQNIGSRLILAWAEALPWTRE